MSQVICQPGDDIQAKADANPAGTAFVLRGTHHKPSVVLQKRHNGDQFIGEGAILDGDGVTEFAFAGLRGGESAQDIIIRNMGVTGYVPGAQAAAIRPYGYAWRWTLEDLDIHHNANWGVMVDRDWQVRRCHIHHMGTMGLGGGGGVVEECEIDNNNTSGADSHWEAGGCKFVYCTGMKVRDNFVHHNRGPGIWFNGNSTDALIQDNRCEDNHGPGIDWEINRGAIIENNWCLRNGVDENWANDYSLGGGGILVLNGSEVIIRNNEILDNQGGIGLVNAIRAGFPSLDNVDVYGNVIGYSARQSGIAAGDGATVPGVTRVRFHDNQYKIDPARQAFRIGNTNMTLAGWQKYYPTEKMYEGEAPPPPPPPPPPPQERPEKPEALEVERVVLWAPVSDADSYEVQYKPARDKPWVVVAKPVTEGLDVDERGRYRVRAANEAGASPWAYLTV